MKRTQQEADHIKWLKFAISLSQVEFESLTAGQRLDLKNDFRAFVNSMPDHRNSFPFNVLKGLPPESPFSKMIPEQAELDERHAKEILAAEIVNLAGPNVIQMHKSKRPIHISVARIGDSFDTMISAEEPELRIVLLLAYHLKGSRIPASMLRRCPRCTKVFITSRKPRADRSLYCDRKCSGNTASDTLRRRKNLLTSAKRLLLDGRSIDALGKKIMPGDREWFIRRLGLNSAGKLPAGKSVPQKNRRLKAV